MLPATVSYPEVCRCRCRRIAFAIYDANRGEIAGADAAAVAAASVDLARIKLINPTQSKFNDCDIIIL